METRSSYTIPLYKGRFAIMFTDEVIPIDKNYKYNHELFDITYAHTCLVGETVDNKDYTTILVAFNTNNSFSKLTYGTLAHECFHAVHMALARKGMTHSDEGEEAYAYLIDWMYAKVMKHVLAFDIKIHLKA